MCTSALLKKAAFHSSCAHCPIPRVSHIKRAASPSLHKIQLDCLRVYHGAEAPVVVGTHFCEYIAEVHRLDGNIALAQDRADAHVLHLEAKSAKIQSCWIAYTYTDACMYDCSVQVSIFCVKNRNPIALIFRKIWNVLYEMGLVDFILQHKI